MSDKKELKNDEIVESDNKSGEKLVSRAADAYITIYNDTDVSICYQFDDSSGMLKIFPNDSATIGLGGFDAHIIITTISGGKVLTGYGSNGTSTIVTWNKVANIELTNQEIRDITYYSYSGGNIHITSVEDPIPACLYLNESYSVPNFVDPEPLEIYVWMRYVTINDIFFTDSSNNIITPTESEVSSTIDNWEHIFLFTFAPNASIAKIYYRSDSAEPSGSGNCYENADFTGIINGVTSSNGMTYGGKYYYSSNILSGTRSFKLTGWMS